jgi:hypothetical protein
MDFPELYYRPKMARILAASNAGENDDRSAAYNTWQTATPTNLPHLFGAFSLLEIASYR